MQSCEAFLRVHAAAYGGYRSKRAGARRQWHNRTAVREEAARPAGCDNRFLRRRVRFSLLAGMLRCSGEEAEEPMQQGPAVRNDGGGCRGDGGGRGGDADGDGERVGGEGEESGGGEEWEFGILCG